MLRTSRAEPRLAVGLGSARLEAGSKRARLVQEELLVERGRIEADIERLRLALAETEVLWQPYGRLLGWLRHPIAIALLQSYARRRVRVR